MRGRRSRDRRARAFAFRQRTNAAQAFGHDAAGGGRNINANHVAPIFKGTWTILRLHPNWMKIIQPKVAKLPWVIVPINSSTLKGLHRRARIGDATPLGLNLFWGVDPA
jgi:hypothetical protein